jgi:hypothetical protein
MTSYNATGIPGLTGGYAYPPGSSMTQFMDGITGMANQATFSGANGQDTVSWAMGLAQQAQANKQAQMNSGGSGSANGGNASISQIMQALMSIMSSLIEQAKQKQAA